MKLICKACDGELHRLGDYPFDFLYYCETCHRWGRLKLEWVRNPRTHAGIYIRGVSHPQKKQRERAGKRSEHVQV